MCVNDLGVVVGLDTDSSGVTHGFIDRSGNITALNVPGAADTLVTCINDFGVILGFYTDSSGNVHGFELKPAPGPRGG